MGNIRFFMCVACSVAVLTSCVTTNKTAKTADFSTETFNATVADLEVSDKRITTTMNPVPKEVRRGGMNNIKRTVEAKALQENGNADVLVNPEFTYTVERGFFSKKVKSITVTGRPAKYKNFHSLNDSVWSNPTFRGVAVRTSSLIRKPKVHSGKPFFLNNNYENNYESGEGKLRKGFSGNIDLGCSYDFERERAVPHLYLNLGYNINPYIYVGAGSGVDWNTDDNWIFVPVYGNVRCYFSRNSSAPFFDARIGGAFECKESRVDGGTYFSFALGYRFKSVELSLAYTHQKAKEEYNRYTYYYYDYSNISLNRLGLRLGFRF